MQNIEDTLTTWGLVCTRVLPSTSPPYTYILYSRVYRINPGSISRYVYCA